MMNILIAPNSFKGSLTAEEVADAIAEGLNQSKIKANLVKFPIADGGDHTSFLMTKHLNGSMHTLLVKGAYLQNTEAHYGLLVDRKTAIIEVAETSGFKSIIGELRSPMHSSTYGLGELILHNIEKGVRSFIICLGGSATVDGGLGMLQALGLECLDKSGKVLQAGPSNFVDVASLDLSNLNKTIAGIDFTILCDVENRLLGPEGAAAVFGPQKGASETDVIALEEFLSQFEYLTKKHTGKSLNKVIGGGAAGGLGAAFKVFMHADMQKGAAYFCKLTQIESQIQQADWVITGEGSIDSQSLEGKAPVVLAELARKANKPIIGLAGNIPRTIDSQLQDYFTALFAIGNRPEELPKAIKHTTVNLQRTAKQIGMLLNVLK
ncbi:glycerate kinase [Sphingobacterium sp. DK4209]|uniref:Glycerate kinase n=1 Tax=Sphingobacterium zhuxiongii TaxID=2662364 RepID=A0A5Q0QAU6_9SPHI|nr:MULTISPECIES: glycerate kinase [unclassified Sphingobacterium]MVZ64697.1 glycerate kinase [Sphingobacterium sp. DK4209]QGA27035.1 glycerate kinase [Sphingobacterium sp. dk4302]